MYCSDCGVKAQGKFCWSCGAPLAAKGLAEQLDDVDFVDIPWSQLIIYESLIRVPEVRDRIAKHAAQAKTKFSGEDFLACCDKVLSPLTGGVPMTLIAKISQPISERLGLKTGKARSERYADPPGKILVALLCSLAQNNQKLGQVTQSHNRCTLEAALPSDIWSLKGNLVVEVRVEGPTTVLEAGLTIPGQIYDWGKSQRAMDRLFADIVDLARVA
jgi:hypothetical protein